MRGARSSSSFPRWLLLLSVLLLVRQVVARKVSGDFRLNGEKTEKVLAKFALSSNAQGWMDVTLSSPKVYTNDRYLSLHIYNDTVWPRWQRATLCTEKVQLRKEEMKVSFAPRGDKWVSKLGMSLNTEPDDRPHYWYMVIDDCSLEMYGHDGEIPTIHYDLNVWNDVGGKEYVAGEKKVKLTHLSADEVGQVPLHTFQLVIGLLITIGMSFAIFNTLVNTKSVHAALFWVLAAAAADTGSSLFELAHLKRYESNGIGMYFMDALSSHWEAICDSLVGFLLLSVASGWTLPNDVILQGGMGDSSVLQTLVVGLRNPIGGLVRWTSTGFLGVMNIAFHLILAQWGRIYNDDFSSYHDLEHLPGRLLMIYRLLLGLFFLLCNHTTRLKCPLSLQPFYRKLALIGGTWFFSLPVVTWICNVMLPYYMKHPAVSISGCILQTTSLVLLSWLVTAETTSSFHKVSRLTSRPDGMGDFTDRLGVASSGFSNGQKQVPTSLSLGKAKIRLD